MTGTRIPVILFFCASAFTGTNRFFCASAFTGTNRWDWSGR